jgi:hypothetical protein
MLRTLKINTVINWLLTKQSYMKINVDQATNVTNGIN